jgi:hypothetical protein
VEVPLHGVPLGRDVEVYAVSEKMHSLDFS